MEKIVPPLSDNNQPVDLTSCDQEPIHEIGAIQSCGFLLALSTDWIIARGSSNCGEYLGSPIDELLGQNLRNIILRTATHTIRSQLSALRAGDAVERAFGVQLRKDGPKFDLAVHMANDFIIIEAEFCETTDDLNVGDMVRAMIGHVKSKLSVRGIANEATRAIQMLTGYDRVMVYRFHPDLSGEVIAETARANLDPYIGLRYPASDIPKQARALMLRNPVRIIANVDSDAFKIAPSIPIHEAPLDMSMSILRTSSSIHLEYLRNMGVMATMTISIVISGRLWGLISCHHMTARHVSYERRTTAELFTQMLSLLIDRCERDEIINYETATRQIHNKLLAAVAEKGTETQNFLTLAHHMTDIVPCDGTAFSINGEVTLKGATPTVEEFVQLRRFLDRTAASQIYATDDIGSVYPPGQDFAVRAAGMLAIPISRSPRDYLVFFRHEVARSVTWAGDPNKPVERGGPNGIRLTPRKSFEAWQETVRGSCSPWTEAERRAAEALRVTVLEVVLRLIGNTEAERDLARQKQDLLIAELNHRVRNILSLILGLISQSRVNATDLNTYADVLGERVHALARAHDQITAKNWGPGLFRTLVLTEAGAYLGSTDEKIRCAGPAVMLQPQAFATLALVIHELITNAAKYGALQGQHGHVKIDWKIADNGSLSVDWQEVGGPAVQAPAWRGFGSTIIEKSIPHELGGVSKVEFLVTGLKVHFEVPARFVVLADQEADIDMPTIPPVTEAILSGVVLLVEDNMIIALDAEAMLESLGADRVMVAGNVKDALALLDAETPSFALLDVNLGDQNSFPIADRLQASGVRFMFATGYGSGINYPSGHGPSPFITKPYTRDSIALALLKPVDA